MSLVSQTSRSDRLEPALRRTIVVVLLGGIMGILDGSMVLVALRTVGTDLAAGPVAVGWVATAYLLAVTATVPVGVWAVARLGGRRLWVTGLVVFGVGSVGAALAPSLGALVGLRAVQGIGAGILDPLMLTLLARAAGPARAGRVMGLMGVVGSAGPVVGPIVGGALLQVLDWRWLFLVNVPIIVTALVLALRTLPRDVPTARPPRLDVLGVALVGPGVAAAVLGLSRIEAEHTVAAWPVLLPLGLAVLLLAGYTVHALRRSAPLLDLRLLSERGVTPSLLAAGTNGLVTFGALFLLPLAYQQGFGLDPARSGLLLAPLGAASMIAMPLSGRLSDRIGSRPVALAGGVVALTGTVLLALTAALPATAVGGLLLGLGLGAVGAPAIGSVFRTVPAAAAAQGSALLYVVNQLGAALGIAAAALVVAAGGTGFWLLTGGVVAGLLACSRLPQPAPTPAVARG